MLRGFDSWGWGYVLQRLRVLPTSAPRHLMLCVADHFEPFHRKLQPDGCITGGVDANTARHRVQAWCEGYRQSVSGVQDDDGHTPQHTFFYPWDEYDPKVLDAVGRFCAQGFGEVEVHLHHRADTAEGVQGRLAQCRETYAGEHGLLGRVGGRPGYVFVHGNWALCNSRPDRDWCGVSQELAVLLKTGCYMDCTFPSAPSPTQPRFVNQIYYGGDPVAGRCGHRLIKPVRVGEVPAENSLLMVPGPLGVAWRGGHHRCRPHLENGEITVRHPAVKARFEHWCRLHIQVAGRPEWAFVKLHTHGLDQQRRDSVTGEAFRAFHAGLRSWCHAIGMQLHYVAAREMYNIIKAAEAGEGGNPANWRDYVFAPPPVIVR